MAPSKKNQKKQHLNQNPKIQDYIIYHTKYKVKLHKKREDSIILWKN